MRAAARSREITASSNINVSMRSNERASHQNWQPTRPTTSIPLCEPRCEAGVHDEQQLLLAALQADGDLKSAFRRRALVLHPDKGGDAIRFHDLCTAFMDMERNEVTHAPGKKGCGTTLQMLAAVEPRVLDSLSFLGLQWDLAVSGLDEAKTCMSAGDFGAACEHLSAVIRSLVSMGAEPCILQDPVPGVGSAGKVSFCAANFAANTKHHLEGQAGDELSSDDLWLQEAMGSPQLFNGDHNDRVLVPTQVDSNTPGSNQDSCPRFASRHATCGCTSLHEASCQVVGSLVVESNIKLGQGCSTTGDAVKYGNIGFSSGGQKSDPQVVSPQERLHAAGEAPVRHGKENASNLLASCLGMRSDARRKLGEPAAVWMADMKRAALLLARAPSHCTS